jgi:hypothetical protein
VQSLLQSFKSDKNRTCSKKQTWWLRCLDLIVSGLDLIVLCLDLIALALDLIVLCLDLIALALDLNGQNWKTVTSGAHSQTLGIRNRSYLSISESDTSELVPGSRKNRTVLSGPF